MARRHRIMRWGGTLLISSLCVLAHAQRTPSPEDPKAVVAETQQYARKQGMVRIGGVTWKCSDKLCIATTKKLSVGVNTCQALAELVGSLSRFGRVERPIPSYDLALCNVRAQIKLAKLEQQRADAEAARMRRLPQKPAVAAPEQAPKVTAPRSLPSNPPAAASPRVQPESAPVAVRRDAPPVVEASPIAPSYRPPLYAIRVAPLAVVGRVAASAPEDVPGSASQPLSSAVLSVPALAIVGHGRLHEQVPGTHLTIAVDKLEVIGKREGDE